MLKYILTLLILVSGLIQRSSHAQISQLENLTHTYSIVARDPATGEFGVAVQTHNFAVGSAVPWAEAGVGAIATQSFTNASFGPRGLALLRQGLSAKEVLNRLIEADERRDVRQVAIVDSKGRTAAWTGKDCITEAGHLRGQNFSVQANMMLNNSVWSAMQKAYLSANGPLAERMIQALEAAQAEGGDIRGKQSAALIVVQSEPLADDYTGLPTKISLRVDDHENPLKELRRLYTYQMAMNHTWAGISAIEAGDIAAGKALYAKGQTLLPDNLEFKFWYAVALANEGEVDASLPIFKSIFAADENWRTLTQRMPKAKLLKVDATILEKIIAQ